MRLLLAIILFTGLAQAQIQQSQFTTNKITTSTGLTNVSTSTKAYDLRLNVSAGTGITLTTNGAQITIGAVEAGLGDVFGPSSATDNAIAVFDGASGKIIKNSATAISALATSGHTHAQLHDRAHGVTSASDHSDWPASVDLTELGYLDGVTSGIQSQLNGKQTAGAYLTEPSASLLYQGTNANLTLWQALAPSSKQDADSDLTAISAIGGSTGQLIQHDGTRWTNTAANPFQATNANLTALSAYGPTTWQATNANLTSLSSYGPTTWQATNANLTSWAALATSAKQDSDADLTSWAAVMRAAGFDTFTATPSSANLRGAVTDENGTGALLFDGAGSITMGTATFAGLNVTNLTASQAVVTDASKNLASIAYTGAGNMMRTRVGVVRNVWITPSAMNTAASGGPAFANNTWATTTDGQSLECYDFDASTDESVQFTYAFPDAWDAGTLKAKFFWKQVAASAATNVWGIVAGSIGDNETGGNTLGSAVTVEDVGLNDTNKVAITAATAAITVGGTPSAGHLVWFKVYRDADASADNMSGDARLIGVQLQYTETTTEPSAW